MRPAMMAAAEAARPGAAEAASSFSSALRPMEAISRWASRALLAAALVAAPEPPAPPAAPPATCPMAVAVVRW